MRGKKIPSICSVCVGWVQIVFVLCVCVRMRTCIYNKCHIVHLSLGHSETFSCSKQTCAVSAHPVYVHHMGEFVQWKPYVNFHYCSQYECAHECALWQKCLGCDYYVYWRLGASECVWHVNGKWFEWSMQKRWYLHCSTSVIPDADEGACNSCMGWLGILTSELKGTKGWTSICRCLHIQSHVQFHIQQGNTYSSLLLNQR